MKNIKLSILIALIVFSISCSKDENTAGIFEITSIRFTIVDNQGLDMLDPSTPNYLKSDNIKVFHIIDGEMIEYSEGHLDYGRGFRIYEPYVISSNDQYTFALLGTSAYGSSELQPTAYVQWSETDIDTIQSLFRETNGSSKIITKVWFNGDEVWAEDMGVGDDGWFEIVK